MCLFASLSSVDSTASSSLFLSFLSALHVIAREFLCLVPSELGNASGDWAGGVRLRLASLSREEALVEHVNLHVNLQCTGSSAHSLIRWRDRDTETPSRRLCTMQSAVAVQRCSCAAAASCEDRVSSVIGVRTVRYIPTVHYLQPHPQLGKAPSTSETK
jgi:hypothetical protein